MPAFCTYKAAKRLPARAFEPITDPAGWDPDELRDVDRWSYYLTTEDNEEILDAVAQFRRNGIPLENISKENFQLKRLAFTGRCAHGITRCRGA